METVEEKAISSFAHTLRFWARYIDGNEWHNFKRILRIYCLIIQMNKSN